MNLHHHLEMENGDHSDHDDDDDDGIHALVRETRGDAGTRAGDNSAIASNGGSHKHVAVAHHFLVQQHDQHKRFYYFTIVAAAILFFAYLFVNKTSTNSNVADTGRGGGHNANDVSLEEFDQEQKNAQNKDLAQLNANDNDDENSGSGSNPNNNNNPKVMKYSAIATIKPDPFHRPIDVSTRDHLVQTWGRWHFWDGDENNRPSGDYCGEYPNRDIPGQDFPDEAWQNDAVFVNHLVNDAEELVSRAMEAIFTEYGYGKPLPPEMLGERLKMFRWDMVDVDHMRNFDAGPPPNYTRRGSRGNGGWTTERSLDGLVRRLLHAIMTNDSFTVVMAGHSSAAGHGNHFHQSYMMQFHQVVAPILARLGVTLITRNIAQGGLGTIQNAMGFADLYGNDIDLLLWDSAMTENDSTHIDLFYRQAILSGNRVPVIWGGDFHALQALHEYGDVDVGEFGNGSDGIREVTSADQAKEIPYAARYIKCSRDAQHLCQGEPRYCATCWLSRPDIPHPEQLFDHLDSNPGSQVSWHPGWRTHQLKGRVLAYALLDAIQVAIQTVSENTMGGPPLDEDFWHVTDYYNNIRDKVRAMTPEQSACYQIGHGLERLCRTPMKGRSLFTPRANPHQTSLSTIIKPTLDGYIPRNQEKVMYDGPDGHNVCYDLPPDGVDVISIVSNRRRRRRLQLGEHDDNEAETDFDEWIRQEQQQPKQHATMASHIVSSASLDASHVRRGLDSTTANNMNMIVPGRGWEIQHEFPGDCDGSYYAICNRARGETCPALGHHDSRGILVGNEYAGWLVLDLPNVQQGLILLKIETWHKPEDNPRTLGWSTVNNKQQRRQLESIRVDGSNITDANRYLDTVWDAYDEAIRQGSPSQGRLLATEEQLPENFEFDYAINGQITTLNRNQFWEMRQPVQRVVEVFKLLDDPNFTSQPIKVEVAFRMRNCGTSCTFGLTHVYWA